MNWSRSGEIMELRATKKQHEFHPNISIYERLNELIASKIPAQPEHIRFEEPARSESFIATPKCGYGAALLRCKRPAP
jgi:hypothetical protein